MLSRALTMSVFLGLALGMPLSTVACGPTGDGDGDGDGDGRTDRERVVDGLVDLLYACFDEGFDAQIDEGSTFYTDERLETYKGFWRELFDRNFDDPTITVDASALARCADAVDEELSKGCDEIEQFGGALDGCDEIFSGTLAAGAACSNSLQCASEECRYEDEADCGVCVAEPVLTAVGADCSENDDCVDGASCVYIYDIETGMESQICLEDAGLDEPCDDARCQEGLACSYADGNPVCAQPATAGESCEEVSCDDNSDCDYDVSPAVCIARVQGSAAGDVCSYYIDDPCGDDFETGIFCGDDGDDDLFGECVVPQIVELGAECTGGTYESAKVCRGGNTINYCKVEGDAEFGVCTARPTVGGACPDGECLESESFCNEAGMCEALYAEGDACTDYAQCDGLNAMTCNEDGVCALFTFIEDEMCVEAS